MTLVDTNVILDLVTNGPDWSGWSIAQLEEAALKGPLCINDVVYAELSVRYDRIEDLEAMLDDAAIEVARTPREALFLAARSSCSTASRAGHEPKSSRIFLSVPTPR
jgi:predicted nucleic acid-binding protein